MTIGQRLTQLLGAQGAQNVVGDLHTGLTAAGTTQATALALTAVNNVVTTAAAYSGVILPVTPSVAAADRLHVANLTANPMIVYPPSGGKLNTGSTNTGAILAPGKTGDFVCIDGTNYTALLSV